jgi:hypothetical protein
MAACVAEGAEDAVVASDEHQRDTVEDADDRTSGLPHLVDMGDGDGQAPEEALALEREAGRVRVAERRDLALFCPERRGVRVRDGDRGADELDQSRRMAHDTPPDRDNLVYEINASYTR